MNKFYSSRKALGFSVTGVGIKTGCKISFNFSAVLTCLKSISLLYIYLYSFLMILNLIYVRKCLWILTNKNIGGVQINVDDINIYFCLRSPSEVRIWQCIFFKTTSETFVTKVGRFQRPLLQCGEQGATDVLTGRQSKHFDIKHQSGQRTYRFWSREHLSYEEQSV